ncbi:MAG: hypothetical protein AB7O59_25340 [Pirellulales bacterium]
MNAMEKVAWTQLLVSVAAIAAACLLIPWFGSRATIGFALLALSALSVVFLGRRGDRVVVDERDREIESRATRIGVGTTWMTVTSALIAATTWSSYADVNAVSTSFLNWLIWIQFAMLFGLKGLASIVMYRSRPHAA